MSRTDIAVAADGGGGRARLTITTDGPRGRGHLGARVLAHAPGSARVALVAEGALLLAGDDVTVGIRVGHGMRLDVVEPSGTVAYDMRGGTAQWTVHICLEPEAVLSWQGQTFVISAGADVTRDVRIDLGTGSVAVLRETLVLGRTGEQAGALTQRTRVSLEGEPLLAEDLILDPSASRVGVLGRTRVVDTVSVLGRRAPGIPAPVPGSHRLELDGPGTLVRSLSEEAHAASLAPVWAAMAGVGASLAGSWRATGQPASDKQPSGHALPGEQRGTPPATSRADG